MDVLFKMNQEEIITETLQIKDVTRKHTDAESVWVDQKKEFNSTKPEGFAHFAFYLHIFLQKGTMFYAAKQLQN